MQKELTPTEVLYLDNLKANPKGLSVEQLASTKVSPVRSSNLVAVHVKALRRKLPKDLRIVSVRGFGYRLEQV